MTSPNIDVARLTLALNELRLPAMKALWPRFAEQADKEGWSAARLLSALVEHELAERERRRTERHLAQADDQPPVAQLSQNLHQVVRRNRLRFRQLLDMQQFLRTIMRRHSGQHATGVFDFNRKLHEINVLRPNLRLPTLKSQNTHGAQKRLSGSMTFDENIPLPN